MNLVNVLNLQIMMFTIMAVGAFLRKKEMVTSRDKRVLTDLVINLVLPCNIIMSFHMEFSREILEQGLMIITISCVIQAMCMVFSKVLFNHFSKEQKMILQYGTICSNAGFLGNPVAEGIYGPLGLLYASVYLIPQRIVMWSAGISFFTEAPDRKTLVKKVLTHPCIVAVFLGVGMMISQIPVPTVILQSVDTIGKCTTALTMLLIGVILAEADARTIISKTTMGFAVLRLVLIPGVVFLGCKVVGVPELIGGLSVILAAMPAGTTTAILAVKYNGDEEFATKCVVLTTLLSVVMIPVWCTLIQMWY